LYQGIKWTEINYFQEIKWTEVHSVSKDTKWTSHETKWTPGEPAGGGADHADSDPGEGA